MVWVLIINFMQDICGCDYYIICLLCGNHMLIIIIVWLIGGYTLPIIALMLILAI